MENLKYFYKVKLGWRRGPHQIIDDDEIALMLTEMLIKEDSFFQKPMSFLDGTYALEYLKHEYSEDTNYAILLDINMPLMDGWEFLENLQSFGCSDNVFVFMLSSSTDKEDIEKSKNINSSSAEEK
jgi:CheY-like chemotaxis protein